MEIVKVILDYIRVIFNWPLVVLILGFAFRGAIGDFFRRVVRGRGYGFELEASTPAEQRKEAKESIQRQPEDEIEKYIKDNPKEVKKEYLRVFNGYWFERAYNLIYGTQIQLLEYLTTKQDKGDKYINLVNFYATFLQRSAFNTQMADYLGFLIDMRFIEYAGQGTTDITVKITPYGVDFLSYIKTQYPVAYKFKIF